LTISPTGNICRPGEGVQRHDITPVDGLGEKAAYIRIPISETVATYKGDTFIEVYNLYSAGPEKAR